MSNLIPPSYTPTPVSAGPLQPDGAQGIAAERSQEDGLSERSLVDGLNNAINQTTGTVPEGIANTAEETAPGGASNSNLVGW